MQSRQTLYHCFRFGRVFLFRHTFACLLSRPSFGGRLWEYSTFPSRFRFTWPKCLGYGVDQQDRPDHPEEMVSEQEKLRDFDPAGQKDHPRDTEDGRRPWLAFHFACNSANSRSSASRFARRPSSWWVEASSSCAGRQQSIRLTESEYEVSVCPDQLPVVSKDGLVLRKFTLNKQPALG